MSKIQVQDVTKIFGKRPAKGLALLREGKSRAHILEHTRQLVAVDRVSFEARQGEVVVIIGLSGSGKSTLLRCINRLVEPTAGAVLVDGVEVTRLSQTELRHFRQKKTGMVFQHFALFPHFSVLRNTAYGLELMGTPVKEREEMALLALDRVNLADWAGAMPGQLSGGMKQRVGLARALALDPEILLMDEAFSALDPLTRSEMQQELLRLQHSLHKTIIFITHDLDEALSLGDRIILLRDGVIVQQGTAEDILSSPADDYVSSFVSHVDRSKVLTASSVLSRPVVTATLGVDGPRTLLRKMHHYNISFIFVLDEQYRLAGLITEGDALRLKVQGGRDISSILNREIPRANMDDTLLSLTGIMATLAYPLPVVDRAGVLRGLIHRGGLLEAISPDSADSMDSQGAHSPDTATPASSDDRKEEES